MATTSNLGLRLDPLLTDNAKYNLQRIDDAFSWLKTTEQGGQVWRSLGSFTFRPNNGSPGGSVNFGAAGAELSSFKVYGDMWGRSISLQEVGNSYRIQILPAPGMTESITLRLPNTIGAPGDVLGWSTGGQLVNLDMTAGIDLTIGSSYTTTNATAVQVGDTYDEAIGKLEGTLTLTAAAVAAIPPAAILAGYATSTNDVTVGNSLTLAVGKAEGKADLALQQIAALPPPVADSSYATQFNDTTDWTLSAPNYILTIPASTHEQGTRPIVDVWEGSTNFTRVLCELQVSSIGDVTILVPSTPDTRFVGALLISS
jgi:hypothetical protein